MSNALAVCHGKFGRAALYQLDKPIVTHAHREGHLIFYLDGAKATTTVGDTQRTINEESAVAVSPWEPHSFDVVEGDDPCLCLVVYIKPMWFLENNPSAEYALKFGSSAIVVNDSIGQWLKRLMVLLLEEEGQHMFDGLLFELTRLCFEQSWRVASDSRVAAANGHFTDFRVRRSLRLMQEQFNEDLEIDQLARDVGLSRPHFFKLFKRQMGVTPNIYLNTLRAEQAIEDLMTTEKSVTDIAYDLGFSSQASFTRFFSSNVGIAPSEYRRVAHRS